MRSVSPIVTAASVLVSTLENTGIDRVFTVAGESYLALFDALFDSSIDVVTCRHESGAGFMALGDARLGRPAGVVIVSRGPGASNAAISVHAAQQDAAPLLMIVGHVPLAHMGKRSFQEIDYARTYSHMSKGVFTVTAADDMAAMTKMALQTAMSGIPGPVLLVVPEDILSAAANDSTVQSVSIAQAPEPDSGQMARLRTVLGKAARPLVLLGGGIERPDDGREKMRQFARQWNLPVAVSFRRHDLFNGNDPLYAGEIGLLTPPDHVALVNEADLILLFGTRLSDITSQGFTFPKTMRENQQIIHVHDSPDTLVHQCDPDLSIIASPGRVIEILGAPADALADRTDWISKLRQAQQDIAHLPETFADDGIPFPVVINRLLSHLPDDALLTTDAGSFAAPLYKALQIQGKQRLLASMSGAMGVGIPAAVAAALRHPARPVIALVGDGGLMMTGNEMATALAQKLPIKILLSNNGSYGSIRIHQERFYRGRTVGTDLVNPDFSQWAAAFGCRHFFAGEPSELAIMQDWLDADGPAMLEIRTSLSASLP